MKPIAALVLAAGMSTRMGKPKMLLPWRGANIISAVIQTLKEASITEILVVTGASCREVEASLAPFKIRTVFNPVYRNGEMLDSFRIGLQSLPENCAGALVTLGDQPQMMVETIISVLEIWTGSPEKIVMPSYEMHRGHPWLLPRRFWQEIIHLQPLHTLRDFLRSHEEDIRYITVDTPTILQDIDTPEDYQKSGGGR